MAYDEKLLKAKLQKWEKYIKDYTLPTYDNIPNIGLYMEQLIILMKEYISYLPPEEYSRFVTPAAVNNYVRNKIMPEPIKKRYYREHIAYLTIICSLKQGLNINDIKHIIPLELSEEELKNIYNSCVRHEKIAMDFFVERLKEAIKELSKSEDAYALKPERVTDLITMCATIGGLTTVLSEKLIKLDETDEKPSQTKTKAKKNK